jgi:hypothetical protein
VESLSGQYGVVSFQRTRFPAIPGGLLRGGHRAIRSFSGKSIQVSSNELASQGATEHRDGQRSLPLKTKIRQQMVGNEKGGKSFGHGPRATSVVIVDALFLLADGSMMPISAGGRCVYWLVAVLISSPTATRLSLDYPTIWKRTSRN